MAGSTHATGAPVPPMIASGHGSATSPGPGGSTDIAGGTSPSAASATVAPSSSSLARPATRAFARAPTPHPRAPSEGVDVDLEGVFDELSSEAKAYDDREAPASSEQFDSPVAFEARPVADHAEPNDSGPPEPPPRPPAKTDTASATVERTTIDKPGDRPDKLVEESVRGASHDQVLASATPASEDDVEDEDEDLAPPALVRDDAPMRRDEAPAPRRESGSIRRNSSLSLRDAPVRKAPRPVTVRQGPPLPVAKSAWRDEVVYWTYEVFDGVVERGAPIASPLDDLAERFDVPDSVLPALVVLYGAHLAGERGVAPVHVARVLGSWDEALGRGVLAMRGLATFAESRVRIAGPIQRFLDEIAVETGALVGVPGTIALVGPHAVIAKPETPLKVVAVRWLAEVGGAILAAHEDADLAELFVEARARGAAPMFRIGDDDLMELGTDPAILVVTSEEVAESLGVPRLG